LTRLGCKVGGVRKGYERNDGEHIVEVGTSGLGMMLLCISGKYEPGSQRYVVSVEATHTVTRRNPVLH